MSLPNDTATRIARIVTADAKRFRDANPQGIIATGMLAEFIRAPLQAEIEAGTLPKKLTVKPRKQPETATDEAWLLSLEAKDIYGHIDIRRELGKAQTWGENTKPVTKITRKHLINWLNRIPVPIGYNGRGKSSNDQKPKALAPKGWLAELRSMYPTSVYFVAGGEFEIKGESEHAWTQLPASVRMAIEKELSR